MAWGKLQPFIFISISLGKCFIWKRGEIPTFLLNSVNASLSIYWDSWRTPSWHIIPWHLSLHEPTYTPDTLAIKTHQENSLHFGSRWLFSVSYQIGQREVVGGKVKRKLKKGRRKVPINTENEGNCEILFHNHLPSPLKLLDYDVLTK